MKRARITVDGAACWTEVTGEELRLEDGRRLEAAAATYLPPCTPTKIIAVHLSYRSRCEEYKMARPPREPSYFMKPVSSLSSSGAPVVRPKGCRYLNYEGEIALIIGKRCKGVTQREALSYVGAYTAANDFGVHDFRHADRGSMFRVKGMDGFCPLGPYIVDASDVDPTRLTVRTYVNGEMVQEGSCSDDLLFPFAYMIADISRHITLEPGDVLLTGTPAHSRPVAPGDVVEVEVGGIGRLSNTVVEGMEEAQDVGERPQESANTLHVALAMDEEEAERRVSRG